MSAECNSRPVDFQGLGSRRVVACFDGGPITSDGGVLLLSEAESALGLFRRASSCFVDHREPARIEHTVEELLAQRILALALGYEDLNDHDRLRSDPLLAAAVGKVDPTGAARPRTRDRRSPLASSSILCQGAPKLIAVGAAKLIRGCSTSIVPRSFTSPRSRSATSAWRDPHSSA